jgi:D-3-phosphoglycerate dehydrogenase
VGLRAEPRLVQIDGHTVDVPPSAHLLVVNNDDRPGVIGRVGTILGDAGVNIADMDVGRSARAAGALMVISTSEAVSDEVADRLRAADGITAVSVIG